MKMRDIMNRLNESLLITELFDKPVSELEEISGRQAEEKYGLYDIIKAYRFTVSNQEFIIYFDNCGGNGVTTVGFADITDGGVSHSLTGAFKGYNAIITTVLHVIYSYLLNDCPDTLYFTGANSRQQKFYSYLMSKIKTRIPKEYTILQKDEGTCFYITRFPDKFLWRDGQYELFE